MKSSTETIVAAAVRIKVESEELKAMMWNGERVYPDKLIVTSPPPARHGTLMHPLKSFVSANDQGFLTSTGRYVDRKEAMQIVKAANQPMTDVPHQDDQLFSEDLW